MFSRLGDKGGENLGQNEFNWLQLVWFECPRCWNPCVSSTFGWFPFPVSSLWGNKKWGPTISISNVGNILEKNQLNRQKMLQFECPRYWNPCVLFTFGGFPFPLSSLPLNASSAAAVRDAIRRSGKRGYNGKGEFSQLPIWMTQRGLSAWGIQTGPFAAR